MEKTGNCDASSLNFGYCLLVGRSGPSGDDQIRRRSPGGSIPLRGQVLTGCRRTQTTPTPGLLDLRVDKTGAEAR
jgi:hypothetical protein